MADKRITIGDRSHLVDIVAPAGTLAESESELETRVPAAIAPWPISAQPRESLSMGGVQNQTNYTVNIGYRTDVLPQFALVERCCTERRFQIVAIVPTEYRDGLNLTCVTNG